MSVINFIISWFANMEVPADEKSHVNQLKISGFLQRILVWESCVTGSGPEMEILDKFTT